MKTLELMRWAYLKNSRPEIRDGYSSAIDRFVVDYFIKHK